MAYRSSARWIAPLALLGALAAILIVLSSSNGSSSPDAGTSSLSERTGPTTTATGTTTTQTTSTGATTTSATTRPYYVVKPGDVLSAIADTTGVPLSRIEELNPSVDAQTLHAGQKIKLAP